MKPTVRKKTLREFGYLIGIGVPVFIGWILPIIFGHQFRIWTLWVGITGLSFAVIKPSLLLIPYQAWMRIGHWLGWFNSHIILGLIFVLVLQPMALIMRMFGYDPLRKKWRTDKSYREIRNDNHTDLTRIF